MSTRSFLRAAPLALALLLPAATGCQSAYYATLEKFGVHKREILVDRVEEGREAQADAQAQFKTTYETFKELAGIDGGELESVYNRLNNEYERCVGEAKTVSSRIEGIESVAADLFDEWEDELAEYSNADLARQSRQRLEDTRQRSEELVLLMRQSEGRMEPVLAKFKDSVLYLKHNLNAQAIASLEDTVVDIGDDIDRLIADMDRSIAEADEFVASMSDGA